MRKPDLKKGDRIEQITMGPDPDPLPTGSRGTVRDVMRFVNSYQVAVDWDADVGRSLALVCPPDVYRKIEENG